MGKGSYSMFVRRVGGVLAAGAAFIACLAVAATPAAAEGETAQGTGTFEGWAHCPDGSTTTFDFVASGGATVSGTFSFTCSATGSWSETSFGGTVSCLIVNGTAATLGGTLTHSTAAAFAVGEELSFNVLDGGPGGSGDGVGFLLTEATCRQEASYITISSGDIAVGGGAVAPTLAINDARRLESTASGRIAFTVTLSEPSATAVTVSVSTADGTATAPSDYRSKTASVTIAPGNTKATVRIRLVNDGLPEPDESFTVLLSDAVGATITDGTGVGLIRNDDGTP